MAEFNSLVKRNTKLFFSDKAMFFTSLITPLILLMLYATFLGDVYKDTFTSILSGFDISDELINGCVSTQLMSSILSVSCVTVAFCSNMLMVQDKITGSIHDITISPVKPSVLSMSYYVTTFITTFIICVTAAGACLVYTAFTGWFLEFTDILLILLDIFILTLFGTALSSIINFFLNTQGQVSAVGTIISAGYGFICGAYMPISQFSNGIQKVCMVLPGTYGTGLLRTHCMGSTLDKMAESGVQEEFIEAIKDTVDCNLYFSETQIKTDQMYLILLGSIAFLVILYIIMYQIKARKVR